MPHTARLRKVGGSVMLAIPPALLDALNLKSDASVGMTVASGALVVQPQARPRFSLDELMAQCDLSHEAAPEDADWTGSAPVGGELI